MKASLPSWAESISLDTMAECYNCSTALYSKLWSLLPSDKDNTRPAKEDFCGGPAEYNTLTGHGDTIGECWTKFSSDEQAEILRVLNAERT